MTRISLLAVGLTLLTSVAQSGAIPPNLYVSRVQEFSTQTQKTTLEALNQALPLVGNCYISDRIYGGQQPPVQEWLQYSNAIESTGATGIRWYASVGVDEYVNKPLSFIREVNEDKASFGPLLITEEGDLGYVDTNLDIDQTTVRIRQNTQNSHWMLWYQHRTKGPVQELYQAQYQIQHVQDYLCEYDAQPVSP